MQTRTLTPQEHQRVTAAIQAAESRTSGEIICVLARRSDSYFLASAFVVAVAMLAVSAIAAFVLERMWFSVPPWQFVLAQILSLTASLALLWAAPGLRIRLVPRHLRYRRAHHNAVKQFLARNIHVTERRTGVLIFLSLEERYAEVIADAAINAHVPQQKWDAIVGDLVAHAARGEVANGFEAAIASCGRLLAEAFPLDGSDANELDDHLVEI